MAIQLLGGTRAQDHLDVVSAGGDIAPSPRTTVRLALAAVIGFAGAFLIVETAPWWHLAPVAWRLKLTTLPTGGNSFYAAVTFVVGILCMAIGWLGLVGYTSRSVGSESRRLKAVVAIAVLWSVPFMLAPIQLSTDAYSYAAQGDLASLGIDPSANGPNKLPNHSSNRFWVAADPIWRDSPAPYGPVAVGAEKAIVTVTGFDVSNAVWGMRALAIAGIIAAGIGVYFIARSKDVSPSMAVALAIANPVVIVHLVGGAHNDAVMMGLLLLGMAAFERSRKVLAVVLVALAIAVKLPAVLALAFIAWNWKGRDAHWKQRLVSFPIVGAIAAGVIGALCLVVGIGLGWVTALGSTGKVYSTFSVSTKIGFLASDLLRAAGLSMDPLTGVGIARVIGLLTAAGIITTLLFRSHRMGATRALGFAMLALIICGPVIWPWYLPAGFALLAAAGERRLRPTLIVLTIASSIFVFPTSVNPIESLSPYQHWLGFGVVVLIAAACVAAQYVARFTSARRERLTFDGRTIDAVLVGPAPVSASATASVAAADTVTPVAGRADEVRLDAGSAATSA